MKNFSATPLQMHNARHNFRGNDMEMNYIDFGKMSYGEKFKHYLKKTSVIIQKLILCITFLYIPVYGLLLFFKIIPFLGLFSAYCIIVYLFTIMTIVLINREEPISIK